MTTDSLACLGALIALVGCVPARVAQDSAPVARPTLASAPTKPSRTEPAAAPDAGVSPSEASAPTEARAAAGPPARDPQDGAFLLVGYVVDSHLGSRCQPGADCEPSQAFLIVSTQRHPTSRSMTADGNVRVLVPAGLRFAIGARVKLRVAATADQPFQNDPCCTRLEPYVVRLIEPL